MDQTIKDFFALHNLPVSKIISIGRDKRKLSEAAIIEAMGQVHDEVKSGISTIPPIRLAWEIYDRAKKIKHDAESKESNLVEYLQGEIKELQEKLCAAEKECEIKAVSIDRYIKELDWYHQPWYRTIFRRPNV
jgi:hypothetical protein